MEAKMSSEMPLPTPRFVICSPIHISRMRAGGEGDDDEHEAPRVRVEHVLAAEEERVADRLRRRERDGQVARVLVDLGVPRLALLLQLGEPRDDHGHAAGR